MIDSRYLVVDEPTTTIRPTFEPRANGIMSRSISLSPRTLIGMISTPNEEAADWIAANWPIIDGSAGSRMTAARVTPVSDARRQAEDAAFRRERLEAAVTRLRERLQQARAGEEDQRRWAAYEVAKATRDELAAELADIYPAFAERLAELLPRIVQSDREVESINARALPVGADRLLVAELVARGLPGFVQNAVETPRITGSLRLPAFHRSVHEPYERNRSIEARADHAGPRLVRSCFNFGCNGAVPLTPEKCQHRTHAPQQTKCRITVIRHLVGKCERYSL
jgi:hypothetical protein